MEASRIRVAGFFWGQSARLVGREVMPYVKAMAILERIMQDGLDFGRSSDFNVFWMWQALVPGHGWRDIYIYLYKYFPTRNGDFPC